MSDKTGTIAGVEEAFDELQASVKGIPEASMAEVVFDEWSAKDFLAHIASWDEFTALDLQRVARGHMPCLAAFKESEVDQWNGFLMRPRRLFPLPQVRFESEHSHRQLVDVLKALPEGLFAPGIASNVIAIIVGHYRDHARQIREWRQREGI